MDCISLLKKLIAFRTTADRINELEAALNFIEKILKPQGIWTQRLTLKGPHLSDYLLLHQTILLIPSPPG